MLIKEIKKANLELGLYMTWSPFTHNGIKYRRLVLQKNSTPHIVSEDCEALVNGQWVSYPSP